MLFKLNIPRLNMAIPRPASDKMDMDFAIIAGISIPHLQNTRTKTRYINSKNINGFHLIQTGDSKFAYLLETKDQVRPKRLE